MEVKASVRYLKTAPRKVRLVCDLIRKKKLSDALIQLSNVKKQAAKDLLYLVRSAEANAKQKDLEVKNLYIKEIRCDEGPVLKRIIYKSRGRATPIKKRMSHVSLILSDGLKSKIKNLPQSGIPLRGKKSKTQIKK